MFHKLKVGAIFIADSHYPHHKKSEFLELLKKIRDKKIKTPQLILMGDIFDLLVGNSTYLLKKFKNEIALLEDISKSIEVIYLEGNHDFYLKPIFKNIKTISIKNQPFIMEYQDITYALSHGDKFNMSLKYKIYTTLIRNPLILKILPDYVAKWQLNKMKSKKICKKIENFSNLAKNIAKNYSSNFIIEGHYHQGLRVDNYFGLPSFGCSTKVAIFNGKELEFRVLF